MAVTRLALLSVYDKTGIVVLARELAGLGYTLLSSGGTSEALAKAGVPVTEIARYTGQPEILGGRVKTLHPKIHGGILADPSSDAHRADLQRHGIEPISLVVVNLYPFRETAARPDARLDEVIEMIDIGGPAMVRAAAKNFKNVGVVVDPGDYAAVGAEIRKSGGLSEERRSALAVKAFAHTAAYDAAVRDELERRTGGAVMTTRAAAPKPPPAAASAGLASASGAGGGASGAATAGTQPFPETLRLDLRLAQALRYGENPHQRGALYVDAAASGGTVAGARQLQGKDLSFNNLLDLDAAWRLAIEFAGPAAAIIKHNNPCGAAVGADLKDAFEKARQTDPTSAFGGIVALNREVDGAAAAAIAGLFLECLVAPAYSAAARDILASRTNLRVMEITSADSLFAGLDLRRITGGLLAQDFDTAAVDMRRARVVTRRAPTAEELAGLDFAWRVAKHVKSNAIVLARQDRTVGIGAGQMSRLDSVRLAIMKSLTPTRGTVLASDAFFPFADGLEEAAAAGITAVAQPGGSVKDDEVIACADRRGLAMVFTGTRHFRH